MMTEEVHTDFLLKVIFYSDGTDIDIAFNEQVLEHVSMLEECHRLPNGLVEPV
jgi:hypothetical protein